VKCFGRTDTGRRGLDGTTIRPRGRRARPVLSIAGPIDRDSTTSTASMPETLPGKHPALPTELERIIKKGLGAGAAGSRQEYPPAAVGLHEPFKALPASNGGSIC
jgi:hypothetical protein